MRKGWVKIYRKALENPLFKLDSTSRHIFFDLLLISDPETGVWQGGIRQLANVCGYKESTLYKALRRQAKEGIINIESNSNFSVISICNWYKYQFVGDDSVKTKYKQSKHISKNESDVKITEELYTKNQAGKHLGKNKVKTKEDSIKNKEIRIDTNVSIERKNFLNLEIEQLAQLQKDFPYKSVKQEYDKACDWLRANNKHYKDYLAFFRNWLRRSEDVVVRPAKTTPTAPTNYEQLSRLDEIKHHYKIGEIDG